MSNNEIILVRAPQRPPDELERHAARRRRRNKFLGIMVPIVLLLLWEVGGWVGFIDSRYFPPPSASLLRGGEMFINGEITDDVFATLYRILVGFLMGAIMGLVAGVAMGWSVILRSAFEPLLNALYVVPKLAILPIFLTIFGFGEAPIIAIIAVSAFFFIWIDTMEAVTSVGLGYREAARSFGASGAQLFRHVVFPAALPKITIGLRVAMGVSVLVSVAGEYIVGRNGLGYLIFNSRALFRMEETYAGILIVSLLGVLLQSMISAIGRRLTPWENRERRAATGY